MPCRKNVSFDRTVRIRSVPSLDDFSREEHNASWFSSVDLDQIRSRERRIKRDDASLEDALRNEIGLESKMERQIRRARVDLSKYSVLLEQQRQWQVETKCPETLAHVTSATSQEAMTIALQNAMIVAKQVHDGQDDGKDVEDDNDNHNHDLNDPLQRLGLHEGNEASRLVCTSSGHSRNGTMYKSDPFSKYTSSNQKWHVATSVNDTGLAPPQRPQAVRPQALRPQALRPKPKYDLKKLTGLVHVEPLVPEL